MRFADIKYPDIANGNGVRVSLFLQGCSRHCKGCFNPETWDFDGGKEFSDSDKERLFNLVEPYYVAGLSILGGEPLEQLEELTKLLKEFKERFGDSKNVWLWTGNKWEGIRNLELFKYVDVVVDGEFIEEQKNISLVFRGSENQRIIDVNNGTVINDL